MYITRDKVRIKRIVLDLHDVIGGSRKVVHFVYEVREHLVSDKASRRILNIVAELQNSEHCCAL